MNQVLVLYPFETSIGQPHVSPHSSEFQLLTVSSAPASPADPVSPTHVVPFKRCLCSWVMHDAMHYVVAGSAAAADGLG